MNEKIIKDYILKNINDYSIQDIKKNLIKTGYSQKNVEKILEEIDFYNGLKDSNKDFSKLLRFLFIFLLLIGFILICYFFIDFSLFNVPNFIANESNLFNSSNISNF